MIRYIIWILSAIAALQPASSIQAQVQWTYHTNGNYINDIAIEGDYIWCATNGGVVRWDSRDGTYVKYTAADGLAGTKVLSVAVDTDNVKWFGTSGNGVSRFDGDTWTTFDTDDGLIDGTVHDIVCDGDDVSWFRIGNSSRLMSFDGVAWETYSTEDGLPDIRVTSFAVDSENVKWIGTYQGLCRFDGVTWKIYTTEDGLPQNRVTEIAIDPVSGDVWFCCDYDVVRFDGNTFESIRRARINSITIDADGRVWAGIEGGITHYDGDIWVTYITPEIGELNPVLAVAVGPDNVKWFGAPGGLLRYDGAVWDTFKTSDPPIDESSISLDVDRTETMWCMSAYGVFSFDGAGWAKRGTSGSEIFAPGDGDGDYWYIADRNLYHCESTGRTFTYSMAGALSNRFSALTMDNDGVLWIGYDSWEQAISSFDGHQLRTHVIDPQEEVKVISITVDKNNVKWVRTPTRYYTSSDGVTWTRQNCAGPMAVGHDNTKWFRKAYYGLLSYNGSEWISYEKDQLFTVESIAVDHRNVVWLSSVTGSLARFDGLKWMYFAEANGLGGNRVNWISVDANNIKWIGTNEGISCLDDSAIPVKVESAGSMPELFTIEGNHPNPFNPATTIDFSLPSESLVTLDIHNITGQRIRTLISGCLPAGEHEIIWDGCNDAGAPVSSGLYIARLQAGGGTVSHRMALVR